MNTHLYIQSPFQVMVGGNVGGKLIQHATDLTLVLQIELKQEFLSI